MNAFGAKEKYKQLKVEVHLRVCCNGEFQIFPLLQMRSQNTNTRRSYKKKFQQKLKTKLKTDVANLQSN